jgi:hypothetical protein
MDKFPSEHGVEHSWTAESRPSALSARAIFASLLCMGAVGASALFLMRTETGGHARRQQPELAELRATDAPVVAAISTSTVGPTSTAAPIETSNSTLRPAASSIPIPVATVALTQSATSAPPHRPRPKSVPRVHVYPFPVPDPSTAIREPAPELSAEGTSGTNPYDEVPTTLTTKAAPATIGEDQ